MSAETPSVHPYESLRVCPEFIEGMNGRVVEFIGNYPFMLILVEAFIGFSAESQIDK